MIVSDETLTLPPAIAFESKGGGINEMKKLTMIDDPIA